MGLSTNEVLLILRARDEATRTLGRVSHAMSAMDRSAVQSSQQMVQAQRSTLTGLSRQLDDVNAGYQRTSANLLNQHRQQMRATTEALHGVRNGVSEVQGAYREFGRQQRALYEAERINYDEYKRNMRDAARIRDEQLAGFRQQREAIYQVRNANIASYHDQINAARQLHLDQQEQIRNARQQSQDMARMHQERIQQIGEEKRALREHGNLLMANGAAVATFGATLTWMGAIGLKAYGSNISAAMDYQTQVRRTATQVDANNVSLEKLSNIGKDIADTVPVAFEEIQPALYDVFSSIDVGMRGAHKLLMQFAEDAVGGTTDMETATRANLAIMNAYKVSVKDASKVSDFMFQLVRKGVGTYDEFAKTIGRAIPSAVNAGQAYQTLGAMMAFMTRNGVSAAMAATSSARALDAISNPKSIDNMEKIGIKVKDLKGEFLPLPDILENIGKKMKGMTSPQRSEFLKDLFTGSGGTIQARRFFNMYFKNADEFNKRMAEMRDSAGQAGAAFNKMAESPQARLQALQNDWTLLRVELGENLLPVALAIAGVLDDMVTWFNQLDPAVKRNIAIIGGIILVFGTLAGIITVIVGGFMILAGAAAAIGVSLGAVLGIIAIVAAALVALGAAGVYVYKHWDEIKPHIDDLISWLQGLWDWAKNTFAPGLKQAWDTVKDAAKQALADIKDAWVTFKDEVDWDETKQDILDVKNAITEAAPQIIAAIKFMATMIGGQIRAIGLVLRLFGAGFGPIFQGVISATSDFVTGFIGIFKGIVKIITGVVRAVKAVFTGDWRGAWAAARQIASGGVDAIIGAFKVLVRAPARLVQGMVDAVVGLFKKLFDILVGHSIVPDMIDRIVQLFASLPGRTVGVIAGWVGSIIGQVAGMAAKFTGKIASMVAKAVQTIGSIRQKASNAVGDLSGLLYSKGASLVQGFINGIQSLWGTLQSWIARVKDAAGAAASAGSGAMSHVPHIPGAGLLLGNPLNPFGRVSTDLLGDASGIVGRAAVEGTVTALRGKGSAHKGHKPKPFKVPKEYKQLFNQLWKDMLKDLGNTMPKMGKILDIANDMIAKKFNQIEKKLKGKAEKAFRKSEGKRRKGLLAHVANATENEMKRLEKIHVRLAKVQKALEAATDNLKNLRQQRLDYISSTRDMIRDFASIGGLEKPHDVFGNEMPWTAASVSSQLQAKVATIKAFGDNLKKLKQLGFNNAVIQQIIGMGIADGAAVAEALVAATPDEIASINTATSQINQMSSEIGTWAANTFYNAGIQAAESLVKGLKDKEKDLIDIAKRLGLAIAKAIKKALKMNSPSKVGIDIGHNFGGSIGHGLKASKRNVEMASRALANAMKPDFTDPASTYATRPVVGSRYTGGADAPSKGGKQVTQNITVHTQEIDPRQHAAQLGWELANRYGSV